MYTYAEKPFTINGVKSWIHCIDCHENSLDKKKLIPEKYHYHNYIEFLYALDTDMNVWINGVPHHMTDGDLVIINSGELHALSFNRHSHYICVKFSPRILYFDDNSLFEFKYVTPFLSSDSPKKLFHSGEFEGVDLHNIALGIMDEWNEKKPAYELAIRSGILKIFTAVIRYWDERREFQSGSEITENIKKALYYMAENFDTVTESDAAAACSLSYNHFSVAFKKAVGRSFNDYLTMLRLSEAEKLLISTEKSITEVALSCGFSSTSHLITRFKEHKGVTPGQWRKKSRSNSSK